MTLSTARSFRDVPLDGGLFPSPMQMLLLRAALDSGSEATDAFLEWTRRVDIDAEFGWEALRLVPMVYHNMSALGLQHPLMGRLKGVYRRSWYETHTLFRRTRSAISELQTANIPVLLSKGAPIAKEYYRNLALRPMSDLDVGVHPANVPQAISVLRAHGWESTSTLTNDYLRYRHALQFIHTDGGEIDLHWHLLPEAKDETLNALFWNDTEPFEFEGASVLQLGPTSLMLQQIVHGIRWNEETPVRWIPDAIMIARVRGHEIDWEKLAGLARMLRVSARLSLGLSFLVEHFGLDVPQHVMRSLSRRRPALVERIENHVVLRSDASLGVGVGPELLRGIVEFTRIVDPIQHPVRAFWEYPQYLRLKWELRSRREIVPFVMRGLLRRLTRPRISHPAVPLRTEQR
ncbi:MAG: nucleotidyltransferase domain-containing protein [Gemmatimonas sp.]